MPKRKSKEYIYNYVDRVRFAEGNFPDYKCPTRGSGWRHNKSVSHLDLATSCHSAASGLNHWSSSSHQTRHHQLRHSRSLDYNHIDRCKDALDIAEYYWHLEPEPEVYDEEDEEEIIEPEHSGSQQQQQQQQQQQPLKYVSEHHQHYRDFKCADDNYHHSSNNIYQSSQHQQQQQQQQQQQLQHQPRQQQQPQNVVQHQSSSNNSIPLQAFEFANDSCSLRRSRSLAVIREETFSDLQISSSNASRRSQLIPRARLVNRGYFRERERLICGNNQHQHHHHHHTSTNCNSNGCAGACGLGGTCAGIAGGGLCYCQDPDEQSNESIAETCDSHKQQLLQLQQHHKQQQQQHLHFHPHFHDTQATQAAAAAAASTTNDYYEHLKRLDKLALGLVAEQLHPWHNDKSDLESLNSDYFKNSLHQSSELKQQFEFETLEQAVSLLAQEKPRIYQSRRQKRSGNYEKTQKLSNTASGPDSCPENSQSSVFPETTTSDDQTDSASLSEQEYDITKIEEIFQKTHIGDGDEESYEIISLTTTTRTRFETTESEAEPEEEEDEQQQDEEEDQERQERPLNRQRLFTEIDDFSRLYEEETGEDTEESNRHTTTDTEIEGTLKRSRAVNANLPKIIAYDSVYLSSEEGSDSTLIDVDNYDTSLDETSLQNCIDEVETLLHISIEDAIYEPRAKQHKIEIEIDHIEPTESNLRAQSEPRNFIESVKTNIEISENCQERDLKEEISAPVYTQILKVEHTPSNSIGVTSSAASKPKILSVVEKRKLKRYSDSAYSSNVSDSSEKGIAQGNYGPSEVYAFNSHIKRQVAEPLYITLKSNLSDNQYHSLPDVNIGQSLKVSESIDAQLRSCYNHDNYKSLDEATSIESQSNETAHTTTLKRENRSQSHETAHTTTLKREQHCNNRQHLEDIVTSEQIYDSIKRFGRAHQKYKQKETKKFEEEQAREEQAREQSKNLEKSQEIIEDREVLPKEEEEETKDNLDRKEDIVFKQEVTVSSREDHLDSSTSILQNFDSFEKPKDAPGIEIENFSQQIERRAKEIRAISRKTHSQHIEYANRAKFRLENTLAEFTEEQVDIKIRQTLKPPSIRIVVTDAQNNIIEEDSIDSQKTSDQEKYNPLQKEEDEKENRNFTNFEKTPSLADDLLMVKFSKAHLRDTKNSISLGNPKHSSGSFRRAPTKPKRQQYPSSAVTTAFINPPLSRAESKKLLLSPKTKERRVLSNQIYRARPVKVITTTTTNKTTTTTTDSFRRNKVKYNSNKMSRPQILQVIDNKRKLENALAGGATNPNTTTTTTTSFIGKQQYETSQAENEYLKKVDAVRCYWSKLVNEDTETQQQPQQPEPPMPQYKNEKILPPQTKDVNEEFQETEQKSFVKQSKPTNDMENLNKSEQQQQQHEKQHEQQQQQPYNMEKKQFILGAQDEVDNRIQQTTSKTLKTGDTKTTKKQDSNSNGNIHSNLNENDDDFSSFMPSIEIVELEGDKKATIVSAAVVGDSDEGDNDSNDANEPQFDHIRYKILKSQQLLRSNVLARNKKEAQFDGLIQYLQEYSFQELLSNNNVVIVEPVRTKIERPLGSHNTISGRLKNTNASSKATNKATSVATNDANRNSRKTRTSGSTSNNGGGGIKRHFFYQPVRVNRELYEEELPNPDTVRNVRKFFEEHILPTPGQGLLIKAANNDDDVDGQNNDDVRLTTKQTSPKSRRARKYRYLTIDTSYGHAATTASATKTTSTLDTSKAAPNKTKNLQTRKWDTASLSSGISSGDLSSPCECNDTETTTKNTTTTPPNTDGHNKCSLDTKQQQKVTEIEEDLQKVVHVQDIVKQHNSCNKRSRSVGGPAYGIPVRSSGIRPRSAVYGSMHKTGKSNNYRDIYEYHLHHQDSDEHEGDDDEDEEDEQDLFGDVDDDEDELCDTYYVSNDILRKIRECGSSVTYYGGRVVQTTLTNPLETFGNAGNNAIATNNNNTTMTVQNPTMMTQTQTRARVREIEICCNNAANECQHQQQQQQQQHPIRLQLEQKNRLNPTKNDNNTIILSKRMEEQQNVSNNNGRDLDNEGVVNKADVVNGGGGITFKLVKSNSCSSRLELAGTADIDYGEQDDTEVVRKMVHHFETSSTKTVPPPTTTTTNDMALTINNQTPFNQQQHDDDDDGLVVKDKQQHSAVVKQVTVNNHINVAKGNPTATTTANDLIKLKNLAAQVKGILKPDAETYKPYEEKLYQTEAKDIFLGSNGANNGVGIGVGSGAESATKNGELCSKVCRNKNVDLAYTFVKHQQQQQPKSSGISQEIAKNNTSYIGKQTMSSSKINENTWIERDFKAKDVVNKKCVTYENTLLPTMTAVTTVKNSNKMSSTGDLKVEETRVTTIASGSTSTGSSTPTSIQNKPSEIIVPVDIHCVDIIMPQQQQHILSTSIVANSTTTPKGVDEKSLIPLSNTSSVTSVIDKTVVKHYVANDKSIYEKRKYDDIEFEEFEIYDPTKDFEKLIEEEKQRSSSNTSQQSQPTTAADARNQQPQDEHFDGQLSSSAETSMTTTTTTSMKTAKSQQSNFSGETETDCYDSLDDKL